MTTDDGTGRLRHAGCEGEQNEGEHAAYIHTFPSGLVHISDTGVTRERTVVDGKCWIVVSIIAHGTNSEKPPLYLLPTSAATSHRLANTTDDHR